VKQSNLGVLTGTIEGAAYGEPTSDLKDLGNGDFEFTMMHHFLDKDGSRLHTHDKAMVHPDPNGQGSTLAVEYTVVEVTGRFAGHGGTLRSRGWLRPIDGGSAAGQRSVGVVRFEGKISLPPSRRRAAITEALRAERTRARSLLTRMKRSRAVSAALSAILETPYEERDPRIPGGFEADRVQQPVVLGAVALEEEAQIEERLGEQLPVLEQQRDEQAADATVAVEIGVDGFELHVHERGADEKRKLRLAVNVLLEVAQ
jgi:hypothetical protein